LFFYFWKKNPLNILPIRFPKAQTACSQTFECVECKRRNKYGKAFASATACVWYELPDAIFVNAHADSNCKSGYWSYVKYWTNIGKKLNCINSSIGGLRSIDKSFRAERIASKRIIGSSLLAFITRSLRFK